MTAKEQITDLTVLYEDADITVCVKPAGVQSEDVPNGVPALLRARWQKPDAYVGVIHRLDTVTGGVMVYARNQKAAAFLSAQLQKGGFQKQYLCICAGTPEPATGEMRDWLFKDSRQGKVFPVKKEKKGAHEALLEYGIIKTFVLPGSDTPVSLCRVRLHTGRTHQIRVQFASRKHPLLGDGKYGSRVKGSLALFCTDLAFCRPGEKRSSAFHADPPKTGFFGIE